MSLVAWPDLVEHYVTLNHWEEGGVERRLGGKVGPGGCGWREEWVRVEEKVSPGGGKGRSG